MEFWAKIWNAPADAKIYIDLGKISEDVIPNNTLDTEDKDFNDAIDSEGKEDTGLDTWPDEEERSAIQIEELIPVEIISFFKIILQTIHIPIIQ